VDATAADAVFYIEGKYSMPAAGSTMNPAASCTIKGTYETVLNADGKDTMVNTGYSKDITLSILYIDTAGYLRKR